MEKVEKKRCAKCGACTVVCPVYRASGGKEFYSGRGKKYLLEVMGEGPSSPVYQDIFSKCLLCGACGKACPRDVDIVREVRDARSSFGAIYGEHGYRKFLARKILDNAGLLSVVRTFGHTFSHLLKNKLPESSGLRLQLAIFDHDLPEEDRKDGEEYPAQRSELESLAYFPGCSATHLFPKISRESKELFVRLGYQLYIPKGLVCCGLAIESAGDFEKSRDLARKNIEALEQQSGQILVTCGSCYAHLLRYAEILADDPAYNRRAERICDRLLEFCQLLDGIIETRQAHHPIVPDEKLRVYYHDPCHLRNELDITEEPRRLLAHYSQVELVELEDGPQCCGQGGLFHIGAPALAGVIRDDLIKKILQQKPDIITTTCSGCLMQLRSAVEAAGEDIPVVHLVELLRRIL